MNTTRIVVYPKDIQRLTGKSYSSARRVMKKIRTTFNKSADQLVTLEEFCTVCGLKIDQVVNKF